jgi:hypothetical protein
MDTALLSLIDFPEHPVNAALWPEILRGPYQAHVRIYHTTA